MNHRVGRRISHILPMALLAASVLYKPCHAGTGAGPARENARAQVSRVLLALPAIAFPAAGRGTALVMWDTGADRPADQPRFVEFAFKGPMSRSDVFAFTPGKKGQWLYSHAITDRFHFGVDAGGARISYHPQHSQLGEDFHPAVFLSYPQEGEGPLDERLRRYLNAEAELAAEVDAAGILQLVHRWSYKDESRFSSGADRFWFDTHEGYLPVLIANDSEYYEPAPKSWHWTVKFEWVQYGSTWYIGSAEHQAYRGDFPDATRPWCITIIAFDPNAEVSDEEFTMEALGAQEGMTVVEAGSGFSHLYSPPASIPSKWQETSEETEPLPNVQKQESTPAPTMLDPTKERTRPEPTETADPARASVADQASAPATPGIIAGTPGEQEGASREAELVANAGRQPGGPPNPTPVDKAHAADTGHMATSPQRVVRIHTLLALFLLVALFVAVAFMRPHDRCHHRQRRNP